MTFKDINGLVEQNVQLRSLVRNLSEQIESREMEIKVMRQSSDLFAEFCNLSTLVEIYEELQEKFELEIKKHDDEAASKVAAVLQRAEEQGRMIESLHTSVSLLSHFFPLLVFSP